MFGLFKKSLTSESLIKNVRNSLFSSVILVGLTYRDNNNIEDAFFKHLHLWVTEKGDVKAILNESTSGDFIKGNVSEITDDGLIDAEIISPMFSIPLYDNGLSTEIILWGLARKFANGIDGNGKLPSLSLSQEIIKGCTTTAQVIYQEAGLWRIAP